MVKESCDLPLCCAVLCCARVQIKPVVPTSEPSSLSIKYITACHFTFKCAPKSNCRLTSDLHSDHHNVTTLTKTTLHISKKSPPQPTSMPSLQAPLLRTPPPSSLQTPFLRTSPPSSPQYHLYNHLSKYLCTKATMLSYLSTTATTASYPLDAYHSLGRC